MYSVSSVSPRDCALAIALPMTYETYLKAVERPQDGNYAQGIRSQRPKWSPRKIWDEAYQELASYIEDTCALAEKLGVTVLRETRLNDIKDALSRYSVVTLFTHCLLADIKPGDITDAAAIAQAVWDTTLEVGVLPALRQAFAQQLPGLLAPDLTERCTQEQLTEAIASVLNSRVAAAHKWYLREDYPTLAADRKAITAYPPECLARPILEEMFPRALTPARAIELSDGMRTFPEMMAAVPEDFAGVLDLMHCNSALLGEVIKRQPRKFVIPVNEYAVHPYVSLLRYRLIIKELAREPAPFIETAIRVHSLDLPDEFK